MCEELSEIATFLVVFQQVQNENYAEAFVVLGACPTQPLTKLEYSRQAPRFSPVYRIARLPACRLQSLARHFR